MLFPKKLYPLPLLSFQVEIVKKCRVLGLGQGGFYQPGYQDGAKLRLQMMCLGLNWDPETRKYKEQRVFDGSKAPAIPHEFSLLVKRAIQDAHALIKKEYKVSNVEDILPSMSPNICIVNFYTTRGRLGHHQVSIVLLFVKLSFNIFTITFFLLTDVGSLKRLGVQSSIFIIHPRVLWYIRIIIHGDKNLNVYIFRLPPVCGDPYVGSSEGLVDFLVWTYELEKLK